MGFVRYTLWVVASLVLLATWGAVGTLVLELIDSLLVHTAGPDTTSLWIAYAGMVFSAFVWPALLLVLTHQKRPLGRMVRSWILAFAVLNLLLGVLVAFGVDGVSSRMSWFGRDFTAAFDTLLAAALYGASVVVVGAYLKRPSERSGDQVFEAGSV